MYFFFIFLLPHCIVVVFRNLTMENCASCELPVDANTLQCSGPCGNAHHISCLFPKNPQYKNAMMAYMTKIPNLRWFCDTCVTQPVCPPNIALEMTNRLTAIKMFADFLLTSLKSSPLTMQTDSGNSNQALQNDINNQDAANLNRSSGTTTFPIPMDQSPSISPLSPSVTFVPLNENVSVRKNRSLSSPPTLVPDPKLQKMNGPPIVLSDLLVNQNDEIGTDRPISIADLMPKSKQNEASQQNVMVKTNLVRSIYISPFAPSTTPADIMKLLASNADLTHIIPNIKCTKLVRKNQRLSFASFKLDVRRDQYDILLASPVWKSDASGKFTIKEFDTTHTSESKRSNKNKNKNPFAEVPRQQDNSNANRPSQRDRGANHKPQFSGPSTSNVNRQQPQRQNFRNRSRTQCPNGPNCYHCTDYFVENRSGHCQRNRR